MGRLVERRPDDDAYRAILRALVEGGAQVEPAWIDDDRLRANTDLYAILAARARAT
jgi:hypothetical protein